MIFGIEHNALSAGLAIMMLGMVAWGYAFLITLHLSLWARWIFFGIVVLAVSTILRQSYWDMVQVVFSSQWEDIRMALGGQRISTVFNIGVCLSCWALLKARYYLIPKVERHKYTWLTAWLHPRAGCLLWATIRKGRK